MAEPEETIISSIFRLKNDSCGIMIEFNPERPEDAMLKIGEAPVPLKKVRRLVQAFQNKYPFALEQD